MVLLWLVISNYLAYTFHQFSCRNPYHHAFIWLWVNTKSGNAWPRWSLSSYLKVSLEVMLPHIYSWRTDMRLPTYAIPPTFFPLNCQCLSETCGTNLFFYFFGIVLSKFVLFLASVISTFKYWYSSKLNFI